jgi:hypothetical protein
MNLHPWPPSLRAHPGTTVLRMSHFVPDRVQERSAFYREFMKPVGLRHVAGMAFWEERDILAGAPGCYPTAAQGDFTKAELAALRRLYPHVATAARRVLRAHRERVVRLALETFLQCLPLPTALLDWELNVIYHNRAALQANAVWRQGPAARDSSSSGPRSNSPGDIHAACRRLRDAWPASERQNHCPPAIPAVERPGAGPAGESAPRRAGKADLSRNADRRLTKAVAAFADLATTAFSQGSAAA